MFKISAKEAANILDVSLSYVYRIANNGTLKKVRKRDGVNFLNSDSVYDLEHNIQKGIRKRKQLALAEKSCRETKQKAFSDSQESISGPLWRFKQPNGEFWPACASMMTAEEWLIEKEWREKSAG